MCVQCGCIDPRNAVGNAAAWAESGRKQGEERLQRQLTEQYTIIRTLNERIETLEKMLGIWKEPPPIPPAPPEQEKPYWMKGIST